MWEARTISKVQAGHVTLERALSKLGLASRTEARVLIEAGRVSVDGRVIRNPRDLVIPEHAAIAIDGAIRRRSEPLTILLHKPRGVVTTRSDPEGRPTVYDLLTDLTERINEIESIDTKAQRRNLGRVIPVGRLDLATSGLLLLTNDTRFADWLTDPKTGLERVYLVTVRGRATPETAHALVDGVTIGNEHLSARDARVRKASNRESHLVVTLQEGKNREIRRLLEATGHPVTRLRRVQFGGMSLGTLLPGQWRIISPRELDENFPGRPRRNMQV